MFIDHLKKMDFVQSLLYAICYLRMFLRDVSVHLGCLWGAGYVFTIHNALSFWYCA